GVERSNCQCEGWPGRKPCRGPDPKSWLWFWSPPVPLAPSVSLVKKADSPQGPQVLSPSEVIKHFAKQTQSRQMQWASCLSDDPDALAETEREIDEHYRQGAGQLVAALLGKITIQ